MTIRVILPPRRRPSGSEGTRKSAGGQQAIPPSLQGLGLLFKDIKSTPRYAQEAIDYSGSEAKTGIKDVTGANIHRKTITISALPNSGAGTFAHKIVGLGAITRIWGICYDGTNYLPIPYADTAATGTQIEVYVDATNINIVTGTDRSGDSGYITLEYTKG